MYCPVCGYDYHQHGGSASKDQKPSPSGAVLPDGNGGKRDSAPNSPFPPHSYSPETFWPKGKGKRGNPAPNSAGSTNVVDNQVGFMSICGYHRLSGTVIALEPPYMSKPEPNWLIMLLKFLVGLAILPFVLGIALAFSILSYLPPFNYWRGKPGFISNVASQVIGFFLTGKLFGPKDQVPVRDIRLRDAAGQEHLVRLRGELIAGNMNVGDEVEVEGFNRRGTLMFRRGRNNRTHSEILVKYR